MPTETPQSMIRKERRIVVAVVIITLSLWTSSCLGYAWIALIDIGGDPTYYHIPLSVLIGFTGIELEVMNPVILPYVFTWDELCVSLYSQATRRTYYPPPSNYSSNETNIIVIESSNIPPTDSNWTSVFAHIPLTQIVVMGSYENVSFHYSEKNKLKYPDYFHLDSSRYLLEDDSYLYRYYFVIEERKGYHPLGWIYIV